MHRQIQIMHRQLNSGFDKAWPYWKRWDRPNSMTQVIYMYPDTASEFTSKFKRVWILDCYIATPTMLQVLRNCTLIQFTSPPPQYLRCETEHALNRPASRSLRFQWHSPNEACVSSDTLQMKHVLPVTLSKWSMCFQWHSPNEACVTSDTLQMKHALPVTLSKWSTHYQWHSKWSTRYQWHSPNEASVTSDTLQMKHVLPVTLSKWSMRYQWHSPKEASVTSDTPNKACVTSDTPKEACVTSDTLQMKQVLPVTFSKWSMCYQKHVLPVTLSK